MSIFPTHTCFDDALDYIALRLREDRRAIKKLILVHGILLVPEGAKEGQPFAHAWVEEGNQVWQDGFLEDGTRVAWSTDRPEWAARMRLQKETRYTVEQAWRENERTMTFGPWEEEYRALCGKGETFWPAGGGVVSDALRMWVVYDHPIDAPNHVVIRGRSITSDGQDVPDERAYGFRDLGHARAWLAEEHPGLSLLSRHPEDDPKILEVWL